MSTIRLSYYESSDSFLERVDARVKLIYILWVFAMIMVFTNPVYQIFTMGTLFLAVYAGRLSLWKVIKTGQFGIYVGAASWLLWIIFLSHQGTPLFHVFGRAVTDFGVLKGFAIALRISSILFAFLIAAMTTPTREIISGLYGLKVSVVFSMVVGIVLRLIPQFQSEHATIMEAQKSRATEFDKGGLIARFRKHTSYIIPLTLRALKIVSDLSNAMESRAFDPYAKRTFVSATKMDKTDKIILGLMLFVFIAGIVLRILGYGGLETFGIQGVGQ